MNLRKLKKIIDRFNRMRILVIGDLILDEFIWGKVERISPEAPVPVVRAEKREHMPGGAANASSNLTSLGAEVTVCGVIGDDNQGRLLLSALRKRGIDICAVFKDKRRATTLKTRIIAKHQQVVRVDWENQEPITLSLGGRIANFIKKRMDEFDALIIEDYGKGVITPKLLDGVMREANKKKKIITVDPKEDHFDYYRGATAITPNRKETENAIRNIKIKKRGISLKIHTDRLTSRKDIDLAGRELLSYLDLKAVLITLGEEGMCLFEKAKVPHYIPTVAQEVFDVTGAGDTVIAAFTLSLASGAGMLEASYIANFAAGVVVGKMGAATVTKDELLERIDKK